MTELPNMKEEGMRTTVLHYHLFKNAGTSLDKVLKENFDEKWVTREFPPRGNPVVHARDVAEWIMGRPDAVVFSSHTADLPPPVLPGIRVIPLIFIRHPIDRIASVYSFERKQEADTFGSVLARNTTLKGYVEVRLRIPNDRQCRNFHVERFSKMFPTSEGAELERGLRALDALPMVGIVERFDDSMARIAELLQPYFSAFKVSNVAANVSRDISISLEKRLTMLREELGESFDSLIAANENDLQLYESALKRMNVE